MAEEKSGNNSQQGGKGSHIGDFIKSEVKPERYERPDIRPAPSPPPPKKED